MKTFDVLGVTIKDYSLKELLTQASDFLLTPGLKTVSWLSANVLLSVSNSPKQHEWVDSLDLMICDQAGILKSGRAAMQLHKDGKSEDFIDNYFKYIASNKTSIALVCDSHEKLNLFEKFLNSQNDRLNIIDRFIISDTDMCDDLFNELNETSPRLVFTCIPWAMQGPVLDEARRMSNARVWMSFLTEMVYEDSREKNREAFFDRFIFGRRVANYEKEENKREKSDNK